MNLCFQNSLTNIPHTLHLSMYIRHIGENVMFTSLHCTAVISGHSIFIHFIWNISLQLEKIWILQICVCNFILYMHFLKHFFLRRCMCVCCFAYYTYFYVYFLLMYAFYVDFFFAWRTALQNFEMLCFKRVTVLSANVLVLKCNIKYSLECKQHFPPPSLLCFPSWIARMSFCQGCIFLIKFSITYWVYFRCPTNPTNI